LAPLLFSPLGDSRGLKPIPPYRIGANPNRHNKEKKEKTTPGGQHDRNRKYQQRNYQKRRKQYAGSYQGSHNPGPVNKGIIEVIPVWPGRLKRLRFSL